MAITAKREFPADVQMTEVPVPFVTWEAVVGASEPAHKATRARYRTLRKNKRSSQGFQVQVRRSGSAAGSESVHSVLSLLAAQARRSGDVETASELVESADQIESKFRREMTEFLVDLPLSSLAQATFYNNLVGDTADALRNSVKWVNPVFAAGLVSSIGPLFAQLNVVTKDGTNSFVDIQRGLLDNWNLGVGDSLLVFQRLLPSAALIEILPTVGRFGKAWFGEAQDENPGEDFESAMWPSRSKAEVQRLLEVMNSGDVGHQTVRLTA